MKNKLILPLLDAVMPDSSKKEKGYKNFVKSMLVISTLLAVSFIDGAAKRKKKPVSVPVVKTVPSPTPQAGAKNMDDETWKIVQAVLSSPQTSRSRAIELMAKARQRILTDAQKDWLDQFEEIQNLKKEKYLKQSQVKSLMSQRPAREAQKGGGGWFSRLWDYQSSLAEYVPKTALGGAAAAIAAYFTVPAVVGYLTFGLAAKLGFMALGADRIYYSYSQGTLTKSQAVENFKLLMKIDLEDGARYPTLVSKQEALRLLLEFPGLRKKSEISNLALQELIAENNAGLGQLQGEDAAEQQKITTIVNQLREEFGFSEIKIKDIENYVVQLEKPKDFITKNMKDDNAIAIMRAICSELFRMKTILATKAAADGKGEAELEPASSEVETPGFKEKVSDWWHGKKKEPEIRTLFEEEEEGL
jgi:hypothetical protein